MGSFTPLGSDRKILAGKEMALLEVVVVMVLHIIMIEMTLMVMTGGGATSWFWNTDWWFRLQNGCPGR